MKPKAPSSTPRVNRPAKFLDGWPTTRLAVAVRKAHPETGKGILPVFHGFTHNGLAIFIEQQCYYFGDGTLYRTENIRSIHGQNVRLCFPLNGNAGALQGKKEAKEIPSIDAATGKLLLFKGTILAPHSDSAMALPPETLNDPPLSNRDSTRKASKEEEPSRDKSLLRCDSSRRRKRSAEAVQERMTELAAAYQAGLNPDLKIDEVCTLLHESQATVYRKKNLGTFPTPIKRGRGSFWRMSDVVAYQEGRWTANVEKSDLPR